MNEVNNDVVMINLDKPRELRFGHKALKKIKKLTGKSIFQLNLDDLDPDDIENIILAGLNDNSLFLEDVENMLDQVKSYNEIIQAIMKAVGVAFGNGDEEKNQIAEK